VAVWPQGELADFSMRRVIVIAIAGASLGGCSSFSLGDYFKSTPPSVQVQLESQPPGAEATTSLGPGCKTPCSVSVPAPDSNNFSVSYALNKFQPATVQVSVVRNPGDFSNPATTVTDPNPVFVELQPAVPARHKGMKAKRVKKPKPAAASTAPAAQSPFPDPNAPKQ